MTAASSAPGKAILVGEHAVVYGQPALALPLPQLRARATITRGGSTLIIVSADLGGEPKVVSPGSFDADDPMSLMAALVLDALGRRDVRGEIRIDSDIPIARGLGSGAAVMAALGRAVAALCGREICDEALNRCVFETEKLLHGNPSGIDNAVVVYEKPVFFMRGRAPKLLDLPAPLHLLLADTGIPALTRDTVAHVSELMRIQTARTAGIVERIGEIVMEAERRVNVGDVHGLGALMTENHGLLARLGLSCPELDRLVEAALMAGALGTKLSGGGRGGHIVAVVEEETMPAIRERLLGAGAKAVIAARIGGEASGQ